MTAGDMFLLVLIVLVLPCSSLEGEPHPLLTSHTSSFTAFLTLISLKRKLQLKRVFCCGAISLVTAKGQDYSRSEAVTGGLKYMQ